jgi:Fe-Mn family superoxide dismutase
MTDVLRQTYPFSLPDLPYPYGALEPHIDETTMRVHHDKHHKAYVDKLNDALAKQPELQKLTLIVFWNSLAPPSGSGNEPRGALADAITAEFGSVTAFREKFSDIAAKHFASGWVALVREQSGKLQIMELHDQLVPKPWECTPLFIVDVWEHAYYLKYQNRRPEFLAAFWNVVDWKKAEERFAAGRTAAGV